MYVIITSMCYCIVLIFTEGERARERERVYEMRSEVKRLEVILPRIVLED